MDAERGSNGVMEYWSNGGRIVLRWVFGDARDPIFIIAFLFELLDQSQQSIFDFVMHRIEFIEPGSGNLLSLLQADCARHRLGRGPQSDVEKLDVLFYGTPTVSLRNIRRDRLDCVGELSAKFEIDLRFNKSRLPRELEQLYRL